MLLVRWIKNILDKKIAFKWKASKRKALIHKYEQQNKFYFRNGKWIKRKVCIPLSGRIIQQRGVSNTIEHSYSNSLRTLNPTSIHPICKHIKSIIFKFKYSSPFSTVVGNRKCCEYIVAWIRKYGRILKKFLYFYF